MDSAGALSGTTESGAVVTVSATEQESFCRAVQRAAEAVIAGSLPARKRGDLAWHLDQLAAHHVIRLVGAAPLGGQAIPVVIANLIPANDGQWSVDLDWLRSQASEVFPSAPYIDVELHVPDGSLRRFRSELESAPAGECLLRLDTLPDWVAPV